MPLPLRPTRRRRSLWPALVLRSPASTWAATIAVALAAGLLVAGALGSLDRARHRFGPLRPVVVVRVPVAPGAVVVAADVRVERRPSGVVPAGAVGSVAAAAGRVATAALVPGEALVSARLAPAGLSPVAALLPPGARAVAVPAGPSGRPPLRVGDHVDLLATGAGEAAASLVAAGVLVVALSSQADTVTVAVPAAAAPSVVAAITTSAVTIALQGASNGE